MICETKKYNDCPGEGSTNTHCTACHGLYLGYVHLCPTHQSAPKLRDALLAAVVAMLTIVHGGPLSGIKKALAICREALADAKAKIP